MARTWTSPSSAEESQLKVVLLKAALVATVVQVMPSVEYSRVMLERVVLSTASTVMLAVDPNTFPAAGCIFVTSGGVVSSIAAAAAVWEAALS